VLQVNPRGFGFVVPDGGGRDVFVPPPSIGDRRDGDRVQVVVVRADRDGRLQGEIRRVVERTRRRVVGVYRAGVVEAYDRRFEGGIVIPAGEAGGAVNGLVVGVDILRPAEEGRRATGRVVEVLGAPDSPDTELKAVVRKFGLRDQFPPDVQEQAERTQDVVQPADIRGREDFRGLPIVTIDGETAMDFDDAVLVRRDPQGAWELQVHIADVAHYVRPATPLDKEALERATSVYFPGTALPMLPHRLSNGICSLNPGVDRLVQSCLMSIDGHGRVVSYRLCEGVIRSAARMTYTNVAKILQGDTAVQERYRDLVPGFRLMEELCLLLNDRRRRRGSIDFDLPEPEVILAVTGEMTGIIALERNVAHRIIEEFMLAANETVARHLWKARVPSLYRVHERPDPRRLEEFDGVAQAFGYSLPRPFTSIEPGAFQAILERAKGRPEERFLARLMLRSMKQARYSEKRDIHFGLASSCYTHFTSPIRRYPDLVVHRLVKRMLKGGPLEPKERGDLESFLPEAAARSSIRERSADAAENELVERKKMAFMAERLGEEFEGFVCGVEPFGAFVELREFFVEGLVPIQSLPDDRYRYDERRRVLRGERSGRVIALGDPARVRIDRVDAFRLEIDFSLIESRRGPRPAGPVRRPEVPAPRGATAGPRAVPHGRRRRAEGRAGRRGGGRPRRGRPR
ncbi:MAG TPA: ribonuclease R, partial [Candidatus Polarisedimenticolaceae bacterium]|nr:ribonuclease R [Candidatus Polarisedimenticolaceae bacterium]